MYLRKIVEYSIDKPNRHTDIIFLICTETTFRTRYSTHKNDRVCVHLFKILILIVFLGLNPKIKIYPHTNHN